MKKIFIFVAVAFLAVSCNKTTPVVENPTPIVNQDPTESWSVYNSITYGFEFKYPKDFGFTPAYYATLSEPVVQIQPLNNIYPGTNYVDSALTISTSAAKNFTYCYIGKNTGKALTETKQINNLLFYIDKTSGVGAGNFYDSTIYKIYRNNSCLDIALTLHTANISNFEPGTTTEIDPALPMGILEQILNTFKFKN